MPEPIVAFADEDTARRTLNGVARFERFEKSYSDGLTANGRGFVRVTGAGTSNPAPPAVFGCLAGEIVAWADAVGGYEVKFTPIFVIYLTADGTPVTGDILEADFVWNDDDGVSVWLAQQRGGDGSTTTIMTHSVLTPLIPQVIIPANTQAQIQCTIFAKSTDTALALIRVEAWFYVYGGDGSPIANSLSGNNFVTGSDWVYPPGARPFYVPLCCSFPYVNGTGSAVGLVGTISPGWAIADFHGLFITYP